MDLRGIGDVEQAVDKYGISWVLYVAAMCARDQGATTLARQVMDCACSSVMVPPPSQRRDMDGLKLTG